jgi:hypothetical protein
MATDNLAANQGTLPHKGKKERFGGNDNVFFCFCNQAGDGSCAGEVI